MSSSGPYFDDRTGKCYYIINGQSVWTSQNTGTSAGEKVASVAPGFYSREAERQGSWPPTLPPSAMKARLTTGFPNNRFGDYQSQASGPAAGAEHMDPYRDSMDPEKNARGPPLNSPFVEDYNNYKDEDDAAESAEKEYKRYFQTAPKVSKKIQSQAPGKYMGEPKATKEWHEGAARYALRAAEIYYEAARDREEMGGTFLAYENRKNAQGHYKRLRILKDKGDGMMERYHRHQNSHNDR